MAAGQGGRARPLKKAPRPPPTPPPPASTVWPRKETRECERGRMAKTARERLAQLLEDSEPDGRFNAQLLAPARLLELEVAGVGSVGFPIRAPVAKKLITVARPARFGRGEETLSDPAVRDTWEL